MAERLKDKVALVTGAGSGIGRAIAEKFAVEGAQVVVTDIADDRAAETAETIGSAAISAPHDVSSAEDWDRVVGIAARKFGRLNILVNNAGICLLGSVEELSIDDWRRTHRIDLDGVFLGIRSCLPAIRIAAADQSGAILNVSSVSAMVAGANLAAYNSAKAAVRHLTKSVALHCAKRGDRIRCNSIHPAFINTPLLDTFAVRKERTTIDTKLAKQVPMGHIGDTDDCAWAAIYLCSDEAKFVTGAALVIDGGMWAM